jgi:two-component system, OmpR family, response regulator PrrA
MPDQPAATPHYRVLVADDNEVTQRLCQRVLEKAGHTVLIAADGQEAVTVALASAPDVIVMDVSMPGMDGLEAIKEIRAKIPGMPIVVSSAHSMPSDIAKFFAGGADEVLCKPFKLPELTGAVERLGARRIPPQ